MKSSKASGARTQTGSPQAKSSLDFYMLHFRFKCNLSLTQQSYFYLHITNSISPLLERRL